jgi:ribose 5-phosphate isomerase A
MALQSSNPIDVENLKRRAAEQASEHIRDGMVLGLGTGSTVAHLLNVIGERRQAGEWSSLVCVPTSNETAARALELGIPLSSLDESPDVDLTIDGADEVDDDLRLVKGLGGALLREKVVASCSKKLIIIVDESKIVQQLATRSPLPIEVDSFGATAHFPFLRDLGALPELRRDQEGNPFVSDGGHHILHCHFPHGIADPEDLDRVLHLRPGILETGLFLGLADLVLVAGADGIREVQRPML